MFSTSSHQHLTDQLWKCFSSKKKGQVGDTSQGIGVSDMNGLKGIMEERFRLKLGLRDGRSA